MNEHGIYQYIPGKTPVYAGVVKRNDPLRIMTGGHFST
jgi:hypothetical protein